MLLPQQFIHSSILFRMFCMQFYGLIKNIHLNLRYEKTQS
jgi:hypothetical protein